jgi:hypothetical protein
LGDFTTGTLAAAVAEGKVPRDVLVWRSGMAAWIPLDGVPVLVTAVLAASECRNHDELDDEPTHQITSTLRPRVIPAVVPKHRPASSLGVIEPFTSPLPANAADLARQALNRISTAHKHLWKRGDLGDIVEIKNIRLLHCVTASRIVVTETRSVTDKVVPFRSERIARQKVLTADEVDVDSFRFFNNDRDEGEETQTVEGSARAVPCPDCIDGKVDCDDCKGTGRNECEKCGGDGTVLGAKRSDGSYRDKNCPECRATGQMACRSCTRGRVACEKCEGRGKVIQEFQVTAERTETAESIDVFHDDLAELLNLLGIYGPGIKRDDGGKIWRDGVCALIPLELLNIRMMDGEIIPPMRRLVKDDNRVVPDDAILKIDPNQSEDSKAEQRRLTLAVGATAIKEFVNGSVAAARKTLNAFQEPIAEVLETFGFAVGREQTAAFIRCGRVFPELRDEPGIDFVRFHFLEVPDGPGGTDHADAFRLELRNGAKRVGTHRRVLDTGGEWPWATRPLLAKLSQELLAKDTEVPEGTVIRDCDIFCDRAWLVIDFQLDGVEYRHFAGSVGTYAPSSSPLQAAVVTAMRDARNALSKREIEAAEAHATRALSTWWASPNWHDVNEYVTTLAALDLPSEDKLRKLVAIRWQVTVSQPVFQKRFMTAALGFLSTGGPQSIMAGLSLDNEDRYLLFDTSDRRAVIPIIDAAEAEVRAAMDAERRSRNFRRVMVGAFAVVLCFGGFFAYQSATKPSTQTTPPVLAPTPVPVAAATDAPSTQEPPADGATHMVVDGTPLRDSASSKGKVLLKLPYGTRVLVFGEPKGTKKKWFRVRITSGDAQSNSGFVEQDALKGL